MQEENIKETNILLGILLAILIGINSLAILFIIGVSRVEALTLNRAYGNITNRGYVVPQNVYYHGWSSSTNYNSINLSTDEGLETASLNAWIYAYNTNNITMDNNGMTIGIQDDFTIKSNYLYDLSVLVCSDVKINNPTTKYIGVDFTDTAIYKYNANVISSEGGANGLRYCYTFNGLFVSQTASRQVRIRIGGTSSSGKFGFFGYKLNNLGIYEGHLSSLITSAVQTQINAQTTTLTNLINNQTTTIMSAINTQSQQTQQAIQDSAEQQIESQQVCDTIDKEDIEIEGKYIAINGSVNTPQNPNQYGITKYYNVIGATIKLNVLYNNNFVSACFYDANKTYISCVNLSNYNVGEAITIPSNAKYFRSSIYIPSNIPTYTICQNGNQAEYNQKEEQNNQDLSEQDKQQADNTGVENYEDAEQELIDQMNMNVFDDVDIELDINSNNWVWNTMTSLITSNQAIMTMFISILSIGVIKLVLVR